MGKSVLLIQGKREDVLKLDEDLRKAWGENTPLAEICEKVGRC
jgi:hypothetical protein